MPLIPIQNINAWFTSLVSEWTDLLSLKDPSQHFSHLESIAAKFQFNFCGWSLIRLLYMTKVACNATITGGGRIEKQKLGNCGTWHLAKTKALKSSFFSDAPQNHIAEIVNQLLLKWTISVFFFQPSLKICWKVD